MSIRGGVVVEPPPNDESDLAEQVRAGNGAAFGVLFERHGKAIYNHCFRQTASWDDAEDLTSVVFLEAWRGRERMLVHHDSVLPWLYGISTNVCRNRRRSTHRHRAALARLPLHDVAEDHADDVAGRIDDERTMRQVLDAIEHLGRNERDVIALVVWESLDYATAAHVLGIAVGTVRSRLSRARARLSRSLATPHIQEHS